MLLLALRSRLVWVVALVFSLLAAPAMAAVPSTLYSTAPQNFTTNTRYVSADLFTWFRSNQGQMEANWTPLEGRAAWNGSVTFWTDQLKQIMSANIDTLYVHTYNNDFRNERRNLFNAMSQLRAQGYDVPKVAPYLDPAIAWWGTTIDAATTSGKDAFVQKYRDWFNDYYMYNTDAAADSYLHRVNGKVVLNTWVTRDTVTNVGSLTRNDVESRLQAAYGAQHPVFNNGIHMTTLVHIDPNINFADEMIPQYQDTATLVHYYPGNTNQYGVQGYHNGYVTATIKPGFWNQNYLSPADGGKFLARNGGVNYTNAWNQAIANRNTLKHVKIESWNEYSEGSGIFRANPTPVRDGDVTANDTWSTTGDPLQYIKATAEGARQFNDNPDRDAAILYSEFPETMTPGQVLSVPVVVRNAGDLSWKGALGFRFAQNTLLDPTSFGATSYLVNDAAADVNTYGGIFRGAPYTFTIELVAPSTPGDYTTFWGMQQGSVFFGDAIQWNVTVVPEPASVVLGGVALVGLIGLAVRRKRRLSR